LSFPLSTVSFPEPLDISLLSLSTDSLLSPDTTSLSILSSTPEDISLLLSTFSEELLSVICSDELSTIDVSKDNVEILFESTLLIV
jgi:hypothetical protein